MAPNPSQPDDKAAETVTGSPDKDSAGATRTKRLVAGAAIGIGSAALVAALLYANRSRKGGRNRS